MNCSYCGNPATYCSNEVVYGLPYGKWPMIWFCACQPSYAYVGCHTGTNRPLGTMANAHLRSKRVIAHAAIDPIWEAGLLSRKEVYAWLSDELGYEVHVAESDIAGCEKITEAALSLQKEIIGK